MSRNQKAILKSDVENTAPDTTKPSPEMKPIQKSRKRTSLDEFAAVNNLRPEVKAGFKVWLQGENFHFESEWKELFEKYIHRTLQGGMK